jgi:hypothetical protein
MNSYVEHPDYNGIYIESKTNKVITNDGINRYFRMNSGEPWLVTCVWSPAYHEILYGDKTKAKYHLMSSEEYIKKYCQYKKVNINGIYRMVPVYCNSSRFMSRL